MNPIRPGKTFHADLLAGLAVGLLLVPQAMSYAQLAGLPPSMGLWCAAIAAIVGAIFGHCHQLNTGPVAMTAVVSAGALTAINAVPGTPEWLELASLLCLLVGVVRLGLAAIRGAVIADLISQPVMAGFSIAAAIVIPITQLPFFLGVKPDPGSALFLGAAQILGKPQDWHLPTIAMGLGCLLALWALKRWAPRWPGMLTVIVAATLVAWIAGYTGQQVQALPLGFPSLVQPTMNWEKTLELLPGAMLVAIIGLAEVPMVTRASAAVTKQDIAIDRELSGQGAAALATACIAPIVPSGSVSRSMSFIPNNAHDRVIVYAA